MDTNKEPPRFNILLDNGKMVELKENFDLIQEERHGNVQFLLLGEQLGDQQEMMKNYEAYDETLGDLYKTVRGFVTATDVLYVSEGNGQYIYMIQ